MTVTPKARLKNDNLTGLLRIAIEKRERLERNKGKIEIKKEIKK